MDGMTTAVPGQRQRAPRRKEDTRATMLISREDRRPADHEFTAEEIRDRFMRYGGVDAATAWHMVAFVRGESRLDVGRILDAAGLGYGP